MSAIVLLAVIRASSADKQRPNFIFVFPDTLRAESHQGYADDAHKLPKNVTPHLDAFAKNGVRFNQAHVMHTQCSPSRCTMMTGRYMHILGHRTQTHLIQDYERNYFRALKESGYFIQYYGKNDAFSANAFNLSVSSWRSLIGYPSGPPAVPFPEAGYFSFLSNGTTQPPTTGGDYEAMAAGSQFLLNKPQEPFFLFLPTRGAHPPYGAPMEFHTKYSVEDVKASGWTPRERNMPGMPTYMQNKNGIPHYRNLTSLDDDFFYRIQAVYLGQISYTDWLFGQLMDSLAKADNGKLKQRTIVFFSSDHGDFGGDYGLVEKWPGSMADVLTRVPLYAQMPGGAMGHVSQAPVQTADILETMLDLANVTEKWIRFGKSLRTQLMGGEGDMSRFVYSEGGFYFENEQMIEAEECLRSCPKGLYCPRGQEESQPNGSPRAVMIRNLTSKLVHRPTGDSELYDLIKDPRETQNLWSSSDPKHMALKQELVQELLNWLVLTSDVTPETVDSRGPPGYPHQLPDSDPWAAPGNSQGNSVNVMDYYQVNGISLD